jgi:putative spermidine/putrescine transport system substrate-binding protein
MLQKDQQAIIFDSGYLYPGPAVKGVTLDMAPKESQDVMAQFGRPMYDELIATTPTDVLLEPAAMVEAFRKWDDEIGAGKGQ